MTMSLKAFGQLKKLMQLATSDNDAEALGALRKANSLLKEAGVDWQRVFERCVTIGVEVEAAPEDREHRDENQEIRDAFKILEDSDLKGGFATFIDSLRDQFTRTDRLSTAQKESLFRSARRARS